MLNLQLVIHCAHNLSTALIQEVPKLKGLLPTSESTICPKGVLKRSRLPVATWSGVTNLGFNSNFSSRIKQSGNGLSIAQQLQYLFLSENFVIMGAFL